MHSELICSVSLRLFLLFLPLSKWVYSSFHTSSIILQHGSHTQELGSVLIYYDDLCCLKENTKRRNDTDDKEKKDDESMGIWWNGHASHHISKLFFILSCIHLILFSSPHLILFYHIHSSENCITKRERESEWERKSMTWVMAKMNRMTKHQ